MLLVLREAAGVKPTAKRVAVASWFKLLFLERCTDTAKCCSCHEWRRLLLVRIGRSVASFVRWNISKTAVVEGAATAAVEVFYEGVISIAFASV